MVKQHGVATTNIPRRKPRAGAGAEAEDNKRPKIPTHFEAEAADKATDEAGARVGHRVDHQVGPQADQQAAPQAGAQVRPVQRTGISRRLRSKRRADHGLQLKAVSLSKHVSPPNLEEEDAGRDKPNANTIRNRTREAEGEAAAEASHRADRDLLRATDHSVDQRVATTAHLEAEATAEEILPNEAAEEDEELEGDASPLDNTTRKMHPSMEGALCRTTVW